MTVAYIKQHTSIHITSKEEMTSVIELCKIYLNYIVFTLSDVNNLTSLNTDVYFLKCGKIIVYRKKSLLINKCTYNEHMNFVMMI
jgi:hypothetical protein